MTVITRRTGNQGPLHSSRLLDEAVAATRSKRKFNNPVSFDEKRPSKDLPCLAAHAHDQTKHAAEIINAVDVHVFEVAVPEIVSVCGSLHPVPLIRA